MKINLRYYPQHTSYSCGPVCLRMIFEHLGRNYSEDQLTSLCNAVPHHGTSHGRLIEEVEREGFAFRESSGDNPLYLIHSLNAGYLPIVNYVNPISNIGHYSIVSGYDESDGVLIFADPRNGKDFSMKNEEFHQAWHNQNNTSRGWSLIIGREQIVL
ncbi:MAG: cysteine peptidase family C39 domain-containing protein [Pseudomonadota bacterium]